MTTESVGRLFFLKHFSVWVLATPTLVILVLRFVEPTGESISHLLIRIFYALIDNAGFLACQTLVSLISIWILGGIITDQIIHQKRNPFMISGTAILILWLILFLTSALTASAIDAMEMEQSYFRITFEIWTNYHLIPFFILGATHGLTAGFFLGREIKTKCEKRNAPHQSA